jgi:hypothetical protein
MSRSAYAIHHAVILLSESFEWPNESLRESRCSCSQLGLTLGGDARRVPRTRATGMYHAPEVTIIAT